MNTLDIEKDVPEAVLNPQKFSTLGADEWPVGTILPVYFPHKIELPIGWCLCAGQEITDKNSPFFNRHAPNLIDDRFPMGTASPQSYGKSGGANLLKASGDHNHSYTIQKRSPQPSPQGYQGKGDACYISTLSTSDNGNHDHGGDNRPNWFGLLYMMNYL